MLFFLAVLSFMYSINKDKKTMSEYQRLKLVKSGIYSWWLGFFYLLILGDILHLEIAKSEYFNTIPLLCTLWWFMTFDLRKPSDEKKYNMYYFTAKGQEF